MKGYLILEDGSEFSGDLFGFPRPTSGEVVFATGMVGYPEALTDPSFKGQILILTYPLIGNYGVPGRKTSQGISDHFESEKIQAEGLIVTCQSSSTRHSAARQSLAEWLKKEKIPGLAGLDTRFLTQKLRQKGTMLGKIVFRRPDFARLRFSNPLEKNLVKQASCRKPIVYKGGKKRLLLLDCGSKLGLIRNFLRLGTTVIRVPWNYDPFKNGVKFDGVVISNGPGDPVKAEETIKIVKKLLKKKIPILGICLGNQLLALAAGGKTYKLKYGHRSQNQPCLLVGSQKAFITSQNHGYAVQTESLPWAWREWFVNLNDGTNEGIIHCRYPFASVQFHPEARPGPTDTGFILEKFLSWLN